MTNVFIKTILHVIEKSKTDTFFFEIFLILTWEKYILYVVISIICRIMNSFEFVYYERHSQRQFVNVPERFWTKMNTRERSRISTSSQNRSFSFTSIHFHSFSFIFVHFRSFSFIFVQYHSFSFICIKI